MSQLTFFSDVKEKQSAGSTTGNTVEVVDASASDDDDPGMLTFEEYTAGGMGRHLGLFTCTMLSVGRILSPAIFVAPATVLIGVSSVGASLMIWTLGFFLSFCGLLVYLELGTAFPRSGGEKVYLEAIDKEPRYLPTVIFAGNAILLGYTASGCITFGINVLVSAGHNPDVWPVRAIALAAIFSITLIHGLTPKIGILIMNALALFKAAILLFIVITGWAVLSGKTKIQNPHANFHDAFAGSSHMSHSYSTALFHVLNAFSGWNNINYVLNEVKNPVRTLKIAGPLGLGIAGFLFLGVNIAYFAAVTKEEMLTSGSTIGSLFFVNVFGAQAEKAAAIFMGISALGNVVTGTFAASRVNQELAKEGIPIPLPFTSKFWASNWPTGKAPLPGLIIQLIPTVIVIVGPTPKVAYPFVIDVAAFPMQSIFFFVVIGLYLIRLKQPNLKRPFKVWMPLAVLFHAASALLIVEPFLRPAGGVGDTPPLPYYLYSLVGIGNMVLSLTVWICWRHLLPRIMGHQLVPNKQALPDGTVANVITRKKID